MLTPGTFFDVVSGFIRSFPGYGLKLYGRDAGAISVKPADSLTSQSYTLPASGPSADGQVLTASIAGELSWSDNAANASNVISLGFEYDNITILPVHLMQAGDIVLRIEILLLESFDGVGASLSVGVSSDHESLMPIAYVDPLLRTTFSTSPGVKFTSDEQVNLYINPGSGASQGSGLITITLES